MYFIFGFRVVDSFIRPMKLYYDNFVNIYFMTKNNKIQSQSKHINFKYTLTIRVHVKKNKVVIDHINTQLMIKYLWYFINVFEIFICYI